jgi:hypothetical protein
MYCIRHVRLLAAALAALASALLAFAVAAPAALAQPFPPRPPGWDKHPPLLPSHLSQVHTIVVGGTPGWQIALIAAGAALLAATVAVFLARAWAARRKVITCRPTVRAEQGSRAVSRP